MAAARRRPGEPVHPPGTRRRRRPRRHRCTGGALGQRGHDRVGRGDIGLGQLCPALVGRRLARARRGRRQRRRFHSVDTRRDVPGRGRRLPRSGRQTPAAHRPRRSGTGARDPQGPDRGLGHGCRRCRHGRDWPADPWCARRPLLLRRRARRRVGRRCAVTATVGADRQECHAPCVRRRRPGDDIRRGADDARPRERRVERHRSVRLEGQVLPLRRGGVRRLHRSGRAQRGDRSVLGVAVRQQRTEPDRGPVRCRAHATRMGRRRQAPARPARGPLALRVARARLLVDGRDRAGRASRHVRGVHTGGLRRHASPGRARRRRAEGRSPAADVRHRDDRGAARAPAGTRR